MFVVVCGIVGLKLIFGLVFYMGIILLELILDYVGLMVRIVYDIVLLLEVGLF